TSVGLRASGSRVPPCGLRSLVRGSSGTDTVEIDRRKDTIRALNRDAGARPRGGPPTGGKRVDSDRGSNGIKLLIVIPALNEEGSVGTVIERSLAAREWIIRESPVTDVQITVVSDGSTDRTAVLARPFTPAVTLIEFAENRGYGA